MKITGPIICICEGTAEKVIINKLLDAKKLIFNKDDLLYDGVIRCRNVRKFEERYLNKSFSEKITIVRVLDSRKEIFKMRETYRKKVKEIVNVITSREIEILMIISEEKYDDYQKHKRDKAPSEYCKKVLGYKNVKNREFVEGYYQDIDQLIDAIKRYKSLKKIPKGECCLYDLLKKEK